jgi:hypothetical protein
MESKSQVFGTYGAKNAIFKIKGPKLQISQIKLRGSNVQFSQLFLLFDHSICELIYKFLVNIKNYCLFNFKIYNISSKKNDSKLN